MFKKSLSLLFAWLLMFLHTGVWANSVNEHEFDYKVTAIEDPRRPVAAGIAADKPMSVEEIQRSFAAMPALPLPRKPAEYQPPRSKVTPMTRNVALLNFSKKAVESRIKKLPVKDKEKLSVRCSHVGKVESLPQLRITFSQPMVEMSELARANEKKYVRMSPQPAGNWYWLSPEQLVFEPEGGRLPFSTDYLLSVQGGVRSLSNNSLTEVPQWSISTPRLSLKKVEKLWSNSRDDDRDRPTIYCVFNQKVDSSVFNQLTLRLKDSNNSVPFKVVAESCNSGFSRFQIRPDSDLKRDSVYEVVLRKGAMSAEGPLPTVEEQSISFESLKPLSITDVNLSSTGHRSERIGEVAYTLEFSSSSDDVRRSDLKDKLRIDPPALRQYRQNCSTELVLKPNTDYTITFDKSIEDEFKQTLGRDFAFKVHAGPVEKAVVSSRYSNSVSLRAKSPIPISFFTIGGNRARVTMRKASAKEYLFLLANNRAPHETRPSGCLLDSEEFSCASNGAVIKYDVRKLISQGLGKYIVSCELLDDATGKSVSEAHQFMQVTNLFMVAYGQENTGVFVGDTDSGAPIINAQVGIADQISVATTNQKGIAYLDCQHFPDTFNFVEARKGEDSCICRYFNFLGARHARTGHYERLVSFTDRGLYRPGEKIAIKGWLRHSKVDQDGQITLDFEQDCELKYEWKDGNGRLIKEGSLPLDRNGGFSLEQQLPAGLPTGQHTIVYRLERGQGLSSILDSHLEFEVQEFRRPEFEVKMTSSAKESVLVGEKVHLAMSGSSLSGGQLKGAKTFWSVEPSRGRIAMHNYWDYSFNRADWSVHAKGEQKEQLELQADELGVSAIDVSTLSQNSSEQVDFRVKAIMRDVNRQERQAFESFKVLPAEVLVGISSYRNKSEHKGMPDKIVCRVVTVDKESEFSKNNLVDISIKQYTKDSVLKLEQKQITVSDRIAQFEYQPPSAEGTVLITAQVHDKQSRLHQSSIEVDAKNLAQSAMSMMDSSLPSSGPMVTLSLDKVEYHEGETAEVLLNSKVSPFSGNLLVLGSTLSDVIPFDLKSGESAKKFLVPLGRFLSNRVRIEVVPTEEYLGLENKIQNCRAILLPGTNPLSLQVNPEKSEYRPGEESTIQIVLKDASGRSFGQSQVALAVVDDAVFSLKKYSWPSPPFFQITQSIYPMNSWQERGMTMEVANSRLVVGRIGEQGGAGGSGSRVFDFRKDFTPLAYFNPSIETDEDGLASARFKMPGNVTRYKILALATKDMDKFAGADSTVLAALKLAVKPSAPRFLNYEDSFELPLVVHNQTDKVLDCKVVLRGTNVELAENGKIVSVPAGGRSEVRFRGKATASGLAVFQCAVQADQWSDSAQFEVPIHKPVTFEKTACAGSFDDGSVVQKIGAPLVMAGGVLPDLGGLDVITSTSAFPSLKASYNYLRDYSYSCTEQLSARIIGILSMHSLMKAFNLLSEEEERDSLTKVDADIKTLLERQLADGGFGFWSASSRDEELPFASAQAVQALYLAKQRGRAVPSYAFDRALAHLANVNLDSLKNGGNLYKLPVLAKVLSVRQQCGLDVAADVRSLLAKVKEEEISSEVAAMFIPLLAQDNESKEQVSRLIEKMLRAISQTARRATLVQDKSSGFDYQSFTSPARADAAAMEALMACDEQSPLIGKLATGLLESRENGIWIGTQANSYVVQALVKYFQKYEAKVPDFESRVFLDDTLVDVNRVLGRSSESRQLTIPMSYLTANKVKDLQIDKLGAGRLYYDFALAYAPKVQTVDALSHGFSVDREYRQDSKLITRQKDGFLHIKAGSTIDVFVQVKTNAPHFHTVLSDKYPAGLEPVMGSLSGSRFSHLDLRDDAAQAFATVLYTGQNSINYRLQATTPGKFKLPPCTIEEMYAPETFARTAAETVIVE